MRWQRWPIPIKNVPAYKLHDGWRVGIEARRLRKAAGETYGQKLLVDYGDSLTGEGIQKI